MRVEVIAERNLKIVLDIIFRRTNPGERRHSKRKELIDTTCIISRIGGVAQGVAMEIARGVSRQNPLDSYNKIVGKKVALTKAIAKIEFLKRIPHCFTTSHARKVTRRQIWEVFHQTFSRWN